MALAPGEIRSGGQVYDLEGRRVFKAVSGGAPLGSGEVRSGGRVLDVDGREILTSFGAAAASGDLSALEANVAAALARTGNPPKVSRIRPAQPDFPGQFWIELGDDGQATGRLEVAP